MSIRRLFWLAVGTVLYTYFGYPLLLSLFARIRSRPTLFSQITPSVTILIPAFNEEKIIAAKVENTLSLDYPADLLQIIVADDGSEDRTIEITRLYPAIGTLRLNERQGKASVINHAMRHIDSAVVVFTDANTMLEKNSLKVMVRHFNDPQVGGVAGEKRVLGGGEGYYWRYESYLKKMEGQLGSVMGATGELFAMRRSLYEPVAQDSIIEDFVMSMQLVAKGWRLVYEPEAIAIEEPLSSPLDDWDRRTRIAVGGFQSIARLPEMLHPRRGLAAWLYISHRVLRWAVAPFLLPAVFVLNLLLWPKRFYHIASLGQAFFYSLALLGYRDARRGRTRGLPYTVFYFCLANLAALAGFWRYIRGRQPVTWRKVRE